MPFARLRDFGRTLRFRLFMWVTLVVLILVTISMAAIGQVVRRSLLFEFDTLLREDLKQVRFLIAEETNPDPFDDLGRWVGEYEQVDFVQVFDSRGKMLWESGGSPGLDQPETDLDEPVIFDLDGLRYIEARDPQSGLLLRVGLSRLSLDTDLVLVNRTIFLSGLCIVTFTPVAGFFLARRLTRPLQWILATARRLQPEKLQERLPVRGSGDELDQLSRTINGMLDRIASYIQRNRDFVASAAHELRSPLAAVRASVEVALNLPRTNEEYVELLTDVVEEFSRLGSLVDRLLLLAEGDAGQINAAGHTSRLEKVVRESVDMFQGVAESRGVELNLLRLDAAIVPGDEFHLRQVVRNLLDNALKFTPSPGQVRVELKADARRCQVELRVADEGSGIAAEDLPHVFERFYRGDKSRQRGPSKFGLGLGLSICYTLVRALEGDIRVESRLGAGTTFTVLLPIVGEGKEPTPHDAPESRSATP